MKYFIALFLMLLPLFMLAQPTPQTSELTKSNKALKPWMQRYLIPAQSLTANLPLRKNSLSFSKTTFQRIENRNQFDQHQLSPYLQKIYLQQMVLRHSDLNQASNAQPIYSPTTALFNRALNFLLLKN